MSGEPGQAPSISDLARDRQIVYATHSPYFVDWDDIAVGGAIARVRSGDEGAQIIHSGRDVLDSVARSRTDERNPHALGLQASEVFFLEDRVILVEGQEDVVLLPRVLEQIGTSLNGSIFGWGVGGADKMPQVVALLAGMGYQHVVGVLDGDKPTVTEHLTRDYPDYRFVLLPADDIRDKEPVKSRPAKSGLLDKGRSIHPELVDATRAVFASAAEYLEG